MIDIGEIQISNKQKLDKTVKVTKKVSKIELIEQILKNGDLFDAYCVNGIRRIRKQLIKKHCGNRYDKIYSTVNRWTPHSTPKLD